MRGGYLGGGFAVSYSWCGAVFQKVFLKEASVIFAGPEYTK
jgi:hypothetical protein